MNTTIHTSQGQNKTKSLEKQLQWPLFGPQAFGEFMQKVKISPRRKFLEGSRCPEAQPLLRPEKTKAMQARTLQKGHSILPEEAGSQGSRSISEDRVLIFPGREGLQSPVSLSLCTSEEGWSFSATF